MLNDAATGFLDVPSNGIIEILNGYGVRLVCNGNGNGFVNIFNKQDIIVTCKAKISQNVWEYDGRLFNFNQLNCKKVHINF